MRSIRYFLRSATQGVFELDGGLCRNDASAMERFRKRLPPLRLKPEASHLPRGLESGAPVYIVKADDVILAEIAAGLHFDQLQRHLARVAQAMDAA